MLTDEPGPLGLLRPGLHAARTAALQQAARHFEASAAPAAVPSERSSRADAHRSLEEVRYQLGDLDLPYISPRSPLNLQVLYQLGDHEGARRAHAAFVRRSPKDGLRARRRVPCARVREALAQAEEVGDILEI